MKEKILIVDDEELIRKIYFERLNFEGFQVETANDGVEALEKMKTFTPDLVLLDILMPRKDGFATLEEIKKTPELKDINVIILTNAGREDDIKKGIFLGANDYLIKTNYSPNEIVGKISALLKSAKSKTYHLLVKEGYKDAQKFAQDFPFVNNFKCPKCGDPLILELKLTQQGTQNPNFSADFICEKCSLAQSQPTQPAPTTNEPVN